MHTPVLSKEILEILNPVSGETVVDGTFGAGGHARLLMERIKPSGRFLGVDWSTEAVTLGKTSCEENSQCAVVQGNYADLPKLLHELRFPKPDVLLLDLGLSTEELEDSGRGFSFQRDEPLDMRYSPNPERATAAEWINRLPEKELSDMLYAFGEEKFAPRIARAIVETRRKNRIMRTLELVECIKEALPKSQQNGRIHPATRTFQALRIYVNEELENVRRILRVLPEIMAKGGRVGIISFHSLEDRLVKNEFRDFSKKNIAKLLTKKPVGAGREEIISNPRSRSAQFRAIQF